LLLPTLSSPQPPHAKLTYSTPTYPLAHTHTQDDILRRGNIDQVLEEKRILQTVNHPFIVSLHFAFQVRRESEREREIKRERAGGREGGRGESLNTFRVA
jgi:hypothetical protein